MVKIYCDLLDLYVKVRGLFTNKEGKQSCMWATITFSYLWNGSLLFTLVEDKQGFKLFFRVVWEPFEEQFQAVETSFKDHANTIARLANVEHQILYKEELQENQRKSHIHICHIPNTRTHIGYR